MAGLDSTAVFRRCGFGEHPPRWEPPSEGDVMHTHRMVALLGAKHFTPENHAGELALQLHSLDEAA